MMPHFTAPSGEEEWISLCDSYSKIEVLQKYIHVYLGSADNPIGLKITAWLADQSRNGWRAGDVMPGSKGAPAEQSRWG